MCVASTETNVHSYVSIRRQTGENPQRPPGSAGILTEICTEKSQLSMFTKITCLVFAMFTKFAFDHKSKLTYEQSVNTMIDVKKPVMGRE
jgi:hypothetical protein